MTGWGAAFFRALVRASRYRPKPPAPRSPLVTMYDSVDVAVFPPDPPAVAGYVGGQWRTFPKLLVKYPHAFHLSIAVAASENADCLDVERGDATNEQAPAWVKRQRARGLRRPVVYTSLANVSALLRTLRAAGIRRADIRLVTAHYTGHPHLCGPACGFGMVTTADATQYTNRALGRNLDASLCAEGFFTPNV